MIGTASSICQFLKCTFLPNRVPNAQHSILHRFSTKIAGWTGPFSRSSHIQNPQKALPSFLSSQFWHPKPTGSVATWASKLQWQTTFLRHGDSIWRHLVCDAARNPLRLKVVRKHKDYEHEHKVHDTRSNDYNMSGFLSLSGVDQWQKTCGQSKRYAIYRGRW